MSLRGISWIFLLLLSVVPAPAEDTNTPTLNDEQSWLAYPDGLTGAADPLRFLIEKSQATLRARKDPVSLEAWRSRVPELKRTLAASLGLDPMPEKTPLNARVTGKAERATFFIENILFESRPGFYVTANLYLPKGATYPAPAVLVAAGHAMEAGKNHDVYQLGQLSLVKQGMIVLAFDPIGQGERRVPGFAHDLGYGSLLTGQTNEGLIVWDAIRCVDYLVSREEVDPKRIGITGNSGGGELAFYAMPLDDRIQAGASFCFVCSYDLWIEKGGNHCICNHLPGITSAMEQFEIIGLNAPRPFLAGNGTEDKIFPIDGTRETIRRAGGIYALHDAADRVHAFEAPMPHGWSQPLREAGTAWLSHWLLGTARLEAIPEVDVVAEDPASADLRVLKEGAMPDRAETVVTLSQKRADAQMAAYATPPATLEAWESRAAEWREAVWKVMGGKPQPFEPVARTVNSFEWEGLQVEVLSITTEPGMEIGATLATALGAETSQEAVLFVGAAESRGEAIREGQAAALARQGAVLVIDPRGWGESARNLNQLVSGGIVMGRPLFAQQTWDVVQASRWLATRHEKVAAHGVEDGALLAAYAAALDGPFERVELKSILASYRYYLENDQPQSILLSQPNILKVIDVPQVLALVGPTPVRIDGVIGFGKARMEPTAAGEALAYPAGVAALRGRPELFQVQ